MGTFSNGKQKHMSWQFHDKEINVCYFGQKVEPWNLRQKGEEMSTFWVENLQKKHVLDVSLFQVV